MTVADKTLVEVQNLTDHTVVYKSFNGIRRVFLGQQKKKISAEELRQLNYSRGGSRLLKEFLSVKNKDLAEEFNVSSDSFEHEYNWSIEDVDDNSFSTPLTNEEIEHNQKMMLKEKEYCDNLYEVVIRHLYEKYN